MWWCGKQALYLLIRQNFKAKLTNEAILNLSIMIYLNQLNFVFYLCNYVYSKHCRKIQNISRRIMFSFVFSAITAAFTAHMEHQKKQHFIVIDDFSDCFNFSLVIVVWFTTLQGKMQLSCIHEIRYSPIKLS